MIPAALILVVGVVAVVGATIIFGDPDRGDQNQLLDAAPLATSQGTPSFGASPNRVAQPVGSPEPPIFSLLPPQPLLVDSGSDDGECTSLADASAKVQRAIAISSTFGSPLSVEVTQLADEAQSAMIRSDIGAACQSLDELLVLLQESSNGVSAQPGLTAGLTDQPDPTAASGGRGIAPPTPILIPTPGSTVDPATPEPTPVPSLEPVNRTGGMILGATVSGRVTDAESGGPLANVEIHANNVLRNGSGGNTRTGDEGRYTLRGMAPGSYLIWVEAPDDSYIQQYYNNRHGSDAADFVVLKTSEAVEDINFALETGGIISGRVSDKITGLPLVGVRVQSQSVTDRTESDATTDASGRYKLMGLAPGSHRIWTQTERQSYIQTYYQNATRWNDADWVIIN